MSEIEHGRVPLAFDHGKIVRDALERLRERIRTPTVAARFCAPEFTIGQLRRVHEAVRGTKLNPGNFLRQVRHSPWLARTDRSSVSGAAGGRPAAVWTLSEGPAPLPVEDRAFRASSPPPDAGLPAAQPPEPSPTCFVYEDDPTNRARIHAATCRYYLNRRHGTRPDNRWHGPFSSQEEALVKLQELNKRDAGVCQHCLD